ncbi:MAG TPA: CsbD family protein [Pseudosphingobacterium sp.]|nr:CsbD family protein [Pseudosphingobacterium sp.]
MDDLKLKGSWNELKGKVKQKWGELTDDDLTYAEGQEEELIGKLQKKTGQTREEVVNYLNKL